VKIGKTFSKMTELRYLCECPLYNNIRLTLFDKLRQIPSSVCLQTLLFGDDSQSLSDNKRAVETVLSFIFLFFENPEGQ